MAEKKKGNTLIVVSQEAAVKHTQYKDYGGEVGFEKRQEMGRGSWELRGILCGSRDAHCCSSLVWEKPVPGCLVALRGLRHPLLAHPYLLPAVCKVALGLILGLVFSKAHDPGKLLIVLKPI